jgi:tetratricopeptide (TPR) repeat protein
VSIGPRAAVRAHALTALEGRGDNHHMRWLVIAALFLALSAGLPPLVAQDVAPPEPEAEAKPYVPPAAWKSVEVGNFYLRRKRYRAALSRFQEAAKTDPYYAPSYLGMGNVYDRLGLKQKALENYRKYLDLLPSSKEAEEARDIQKAINRLERQLRSRHSSTRTQPASGSSSSPTD